MFSILAQNRRQGWQNFKKKLSRLAPRQFFFSKFCHPRRRFWAKIENMISSDYVLCYIPQYLEILRNDWKSWNSWGRRWRPLWSLWPPLCGLRNLREKLKILDVLEILQLSRFWKIARHDFQSRGPIMTLGGVYSLKTWVEIALCIA